MNPDVHTARIISNWVLDLSQLVRGKTETEDFQDQVKLYSRMLANEPLPSAAYTSDSLHHVVRDNEWWPAFSVLRAALHEYWAMHKPHDAPRIGHDSGPALDVFQQHMLDRTYRRIGEAPELKAHLESMLRRYAPAAWKTYRPETPPPVRTAEEMSYVENLIKNAFGSTKQPSDPAKG